MWYLVLKILFLLLFMNGAFAFDAENVDTEDVIVLEKQTSTRALSSVFGYSVAIGKRRRDGRYFAYVGDPIDDDHGNVFKCDLSRPGQGCNMVQGIELYKYNLKLSFIFFDISILLS